MAAERSWEIAYRPLRPRGLLGQLATLVAAELVLFASYSEQQAAFHWATHFLVGFTVAAVANLAWLTLNGAPARCQLISILAWHLVAMFPDVLYSVGVPHDGWMDVFLAHISSHYLPGGVYTWLFIALAVSALYAMLLSAWLAARVAEVEAGLSPGTGLAGSALVRPQRDPRTTLLAHQRYGPSRPPGIVLMHGLGASGAIWVPVARELGALGHAVLVPDLLGFGGSRTIGTAFGLDDQTAAAAKLLEHFAGGSVLLVGHSFGCAVAVRTASQQPSPASALVLVSPPVFRDAIEARVHLGERGWLARRVLSGSRVAGVACGVMCALRRPAGALAVRLWSNVPAAVARDGVQHTWPAYRDALGALLKENPLPAAVDRPPVPTTLVLGDADVETPASDVLDVPHTNVDVIVVPEADHLLPLRHADLIVAIIARLVDPSHEPSI